MNKPLRWKLFPGFFVLALLLSILINSCQSSLHGFNYWWQEPGTLSQKAPNSRFIIFTQSNNSINSRIAQDQLVYFCDNPSIQSYLYLKGERLNTANQSRIQQKLLQDNYQFAVLMYLSKTEPDSTELYSHTGSLMSDYFSLIDPYFYNPIYEGPARDYIVIAKVYKVADESLVYEVVSKRYQNTPPEIAMKACSELLVKQLKKGGIMK